jgi:hypothetical protein
MGREKQPSKLDKRFWLRVIGGPGESYIDAHQDTPPGHDDHSDSVYTDHADDEHGDAHSDIASKFDRFDGYPIELVRASIDHLTRAMSQFEADYRARAEKNVSETKASLKRIEERLTAIEKTTKSR